jgi:hypothetical protein
MAVGGVIIPNYIDHFYKKMSKPVVVSFAAYPFNKLHWTYLYKYLDP